MEFGFAQTRETLAGTQKRLGSSVSGSYSCCVRSPSSVNRISLSDPGPLSLHTPAKLGAAITDEEKLTMAIRAAQLKTACVS
jgi:hypothetical protein